MAATNKEDIIRGETFGFVEKNSNTTDDEVTPAITVRTCQKYRALKKIVKIAQKLKQPKNKKFLLCTKYSCFPTRLVDSATPHCKETQLLLKIDSKTIQKANYLVLLWHVGQTRPGPSRAPGGDWPCCERRQEEQKWPEKNIIFLKRY